MHVSHEPPEETERRLLMVLAKAELKVHDGAFVFQEWPLAEATPQVFQTPGALAFVRDEDRWSALVPADGTAGERFGLFSFHFPPGIDNSGFVGWLASRLKARCGTGVFVICGQNTARGGIFDYWGCPIGVFDQVVAELRALEASSTK